MRGKNGVELISDRTLDIASGLYGEAEDELAVMVEGEERLERHNTALSSTTCGA